MADVIADKDLLLVANRLMRHFINKIGTKYDSLLWGIKATESVQINIGQYLSQSIDGQVHAVKIVSEPVLMKDNGAQTLKGLEKGTIVYIPNAEKWNQYSLLLMKLQLSEMGSQVVIGFSNPARLSMNIYCFLVSQQISNKLELSDWTINMSTPIGDIDKHS